MRKLDQSETDRPGLPATTGTAGPRPSLAQSAPSAAFVSQLIVARDKLSPQRMRRAENPSSALGAYFRGARIADRRMPLGYRKTKLV